MAILRNSQFRSVYEPEDDFGSDEAFLRNVIAPIPAPAPAPVAPAPAAPFNPVGFDWTTQGVQNIGGTIYQPQFEQISLGSQGEGGEQWAQGPLQQLLRYKEGQTGPGQTYEILDPATGKVTGTGKFKEQSRGFFGDLFGMVQQAAADLGPILQFTPLGPAVAAVNAVTAAQQGNVLPLISSAAGLGGYSDIANAAKAAEAIRKEDYLGAVLPALQAAGISEVGGYTQKEIAPALNVARAIQNENPLALLSAASAYLPGPAMPGMIKDADIEEDFFAYGKPGFMPTEELPPEEVDRELRSLLARYPAPAAPSDWFPGEGVPSGVPEWDIAASAAGLPIGSLEQDFSVAQTKTGPQIVDSAGNVGTFVNGEFVVDTGVTPDLSYAATSPPAPGKAPAPATAPAPAPAAKKKDDLALLMMLAAMMTPQQKAEEDYQLAQILGVDSPFGRIV